MSDVPYFATIARWCELSGMGRRATYDALARGELQARKRGRSTLIDVRAGLEWLRSLPTAQIRMSPQVSRRAARTTDGTCLRGDAA
jgi:hypothetical protein